MRKREKKMIRPSLRKEHLAGWDADGSALDCHRVGLLRWRLRAAGRCHAGYDSTEEVMEGDTFHCLHLVFLIPVEDFFRMSINRLDDARHRHVRFWEACYNFNDVFVVDVSLAD